MSVFVMELNLIPDVGPAYPRAMKLSLLNAITATDEPLAEAKFRPFVNNFTPDPLSVIADFTEPGWTGFAPATLVWNPAGSEGQFGAEKAANSVDYQVGAGDPETIYGFYLTNVDNDILVGYWRLPTPYPIEEGQTFSVVVTLNVE